MKRDPFEELLRFHFREVLRLRINIMSAGYVVQGVKVTRGFLERLVATTEKRGGILTVQIPGSCGVMGFANELDVEGDDIWANVVLGQPSPPFERAAAVMCPSGSNEWMLVGVMLTSLSRPGILRLNTEKPE